MHVEFSGGDEGGCMGEAGMIGAIIAIMLLLAYLGTKPRDEG